MKYMLNAYRVLLTRARAGMITCVPEGNAHKTISGFREDSTRKLEYLKTDALGLDEMKNVR